MIRKLSAVCAVLLASVQAAAAQDLVPRFYYRNIGIGTADGPSSSSGAQDLHRLRLMLSPDLGPVSIDAAYEHGLSISSFRSSFAVSGGLGLTSTGGEWLPLQGVIAESGHVIWSHRVDRLAATVGADSWDITVGRQTISYATTLFLTPTDPFQPFDPADPFRTYRAGVDAVRFRAFPGTFTTIEGVVRVAGTAIDTTLTVLVRAMTEISGFELSAYAGAVHEEATFAVGATFTEAGAAFRGEASLRRSEGETVLRFAVGVDRSFGVGGRTLYVVAEYQRDGFGAAADSDLLTFLSSPPARRGELQVFGRDEVAVSGSYHVHPLATIDLLGLVNLNDPSLLLGPAASYSASGSITVRGGFFLGFGEEPTTLGSGSEFGAVPTSGYLSVEAFF